MQPRNLGEEAKGRCGRSGESRDHYQLATVIH